MFPFRKTHFSVINFPKLHKNTWIDYVINPINIIFCKFQFFFQKFKNFFAGLIAGHLNRERTLTLNKNLFHCINKIASRIFIYSKICISCNLEQQSFLNFKTCKKLSSIAHNNFFQKSKLLFTVFTRKPDYLRKSVWNLNKGNARRIFTSL